MGFNLDSGLVDWFVNVELRNIRVSLEGDAMKFEMTHLFFKGEPECFDETTAPDWLTSAKTVKGSTMDDRWFWNDHVLTLKVGQSIDTDFQTIRRVM